MLKLVSPGDDDAVPPAATPPGRALPEPRYWAFLSYSHHDKVAAKRLQKQLETYRVPRRLVGRETSVGRLPPRVSPVFRDRDELHAGADLKASVQEALSHSRWLIVVCTPDSARSPWVNREIIEFKKMHGERRVLALIVRGEPFASDMPGREAEECFPPALRRALTADGRAEGEALEPIAADMRKQGDGEQRAVLKLLAGMLAVPFDDLVRRDMQRRVRVLSAIAGASALGVVVFALMAVLAVKARDEAQHQRVQAEGLIEFMLGDLRKKLEPVGRLEVLDSVGEKALAYYGAQYSEHLDATALGHRSRAMHLIGEIRDLRGKPAEAQAAFEQAAATTAQLLAKSPKDPQRIFEHAQSAYWVGYAAWSRADGATAERWWSEYRVLSEQLILADPANVDWQAEVAYAHMNLGVLLLGSSRQDEALLSLTRARDVFFAIQVGQPKLRLEYANVLGWLAMARAQLGEYEKALQEQDSRLLVLRTIYLSEKDRSAQRGVLQSLTLASLYNLALGRTGQAETLSLEGQAVANDLVVADATNSLWKSDACLAQLRRVETLQAVEKKADAVIALGGAQRCAEELGFMGTLERGTAIRLTSRLLMFQALLSDDPRRSDVEKRAFRHIDDAGSALIQGGVDRSNLSIDLANMALAVAEMNGVTGHSASGMLTRVEKLLDPLSQTKDGAVLVPLARAKLLLGKESEARFLMSRIQSTSYRHPAYVGLLKQLGPGQGGSGSLSIGIKQ